MDGSDAPLGLRGAENLETTLEALESDFGGAVPRLAHDIGGKGILDWAFTETRQRTVQEFCDKLESLIFPRWWQFWK